MIKYIIVDDEYVAHDIIKGYCDLLPNMRLLKNCYDAIEALEFLKENSVDLIFLDINMPKLKGFDFLRTLSSTPKVIVTSAYSEYALEGYELNVEDYLLKPFSFERFLKAVNKTFSKKVDSAEPELINEDEYIFLYTDKKYIQVEINNILFVEAFGNYCKVILNKEQIVIRERISEVIELLPSKLFIRVHKSFAVAKKHIHVIEGNRIHIKEFQIPIGKLYKVNLLDILK